MNAAKGFADHVRLAVRLTPNASRDGIEGLETAADGECWLKARVTAVPEDGKANKALIQLMAKALRLPKSSISLIAGETARKKILRIEGDPEDLMRRLDQLLAR
ncbi:DUF167 domain-containing protein [Rhizobium sp. CSW-27]|uniref:DUF167 domain-containing protein n=1 Tax=Rhizobium sp. CSW-27 TaxID=2839985 RepID=UPI001C025871|nr:DUF167 domain-containing protein [Rhizobium sp. CSW-27]